ncbi:hypothetical protein C8F04DRAFT_1291829 [Mycena alexandri]|uniref:MYB transcription factor n=1 Tax=Mycena alexandri TaxID=1745969 RepID=A0AAD6WYI4_9AGAR|nr:hypothetical protein C8F04DRAFT_1291829 [Mycena alexandri]
MAATQSQSLNNNNNNNNNNNSIPSSATFSFKAPFLPASATASTSAFTSASVPCAPSHPEGSGQGQGSGQQKQRRVSLALPSSPRLVPAWNFRDDTSVPYADAGRKGKVRRIDTARDDGESGGGEDGDEEGRDADEGAREGGEGALVGKESGVKEKKMRRKWTPAETQMLVDGCTKHGVGNWKAILSDPALTFAGRSPVDLKDRFRTYFPEAYRTHYPNARTHLPPSLARAASPTSTSHSPLALNNALAGPSGSSSSSQSPSQSILASTSPLDSPSTTTLSNATPPAKPNRSTHPDGTPLFPLPSPLHPKRRPFTPEEDSALLAGFRKHGAAWAAIAKEAPVFGVTGRRSMDLRDRFRNAWPGEYERAGYKARPRGGRKAAAASASTSAAGAKESKDAGKEGEEGGGAVREGKMKQEDGEGEEVRERGRGRVGRARTDEGLMRAGGNASADPGASNGNVTTSAGGGPVRRRRRAHTSQGFKTVSMPPSVVGSDDEGDGEGHAGSGVGGGGTVSDFRLGRGGPEFGFSFVGGQEKGEETALVGGMRHLDMAQPDEAMPDAPPPTTSSPTAAQALQIQTQASAPVQFNNSHFLQHRRAEELALAGGGAGTTIGRSAWGPQDWLVPPPRGARVAWTDARRTHTARLAFEFYSLDARAMDAWAILPGARHAFVGRARRAFALRTHGTARHTKRHAHTDAPSSHIAALVTEKLPPPRFVAALGNALVTPPAAPVIAAAIAAPLPPPGGKGRQWRHGGSTFPLPQRQWVDENETARWPRTVVSVLTSLTPGTWHAVVAVHHPPRGDGRGGVLGLGNEDGCGSPFVICGPGLAANFRPLFFWYRLFLERRRKSGIDFPR